MSTFSEKQQLFAHLSSSGELRPILTRLNGDTSWMISLPRPVADRQSGKAYFHILSDLWLHGSPPGFGPWLWFILSFSLIEKPKYDSVQAIEELIDGIEKSVAVSQQTGKSTTHEKPEGSIPSKIDAIVVNIPLIDHLRRDTLVEFPKTIPLISVPEGISEISSWNHFENVIEMPDLEPEATQWLSPIPSVLPEGISIFRIPDRELLPLALHFGTVFSYSMKSEASSSASAPEAILYTPHGMQPHVIKRAADIAPPNTKFVGMLNCLDEVGPGAAAYTSFGAKTSFDAADITRPTYWLNTHDHGQHYAGLLPGPLSFLAFRNKYWTIESGQEAHKKRLETAGGELDDTIQNWEIDKNYFDLANGASFVLT